MLLLSSSTRHVSSRVCNSGSRFLTTFTSSQKLLRSAAASSITWLGGTVRLSSSSSTSKLTDAQKTHWESYLASGRGSVALFASIDGDNDQLISRDDARRFIASVDRLSHKAFECLERRAGDHPLDLKEFQDWLLEFTRDEGFAPIQSSYEAHPELGERSAAVKPVERQYQWNESTMSQSLRRMTYAVRGQVVNRADALADQGRQIIYTNIGNPQAVGQQPITYYRQVLTLCDLPAACGVDHPNVHQLFPADVVEHARMLRDIVGPCGTGAYTNSQGYMGIRKHVAEYIAQRDGHAAYPGDIFLTNGASSAIGLVLTALLAHDNDAILIPIPQYPIYSALIMQLGGRQVGYYLDEESGWSISRRELEERLAEAKHKGLQVKGLAMINPGNPTGQVMSRQDVETMATFCAEHGIVMLADEVYQRNVYAPGREFVSAKKVAMETPGCENLELVSFHSTSKGLIGECGRRGGYMELHGIDPYVQTQLYKLASSGLCSGTDGQLMMSLMVNGPDMNGESYDLFASEESAIFESLGRKAKAVVEGLNQIDGIECQPAEGAMYAFPRLHLPTKALETAKESGQTPDTLYALSLLEETGICVVPASGFGQKEGRVGFRTTFLPPEETIAQAIDMFGKHHRDFCDKYAS